LGEDFNQALDLSFSYGRECLWSLSPNSTPLHGAGHGPTGSTGHPDDLTCVEATGHKTFYKKITIFFWQKVGSWIFLTPIFRFIIKGRSVLHHFFFS
jgi:hypothetical protein